MLVVMPVPMFWLAILSHFAEKRTWIKTLHYCPDLWWNYQKELK